MYKVTYLFNDFILSNVLQSRNLGANFWGFFTFFFNDDSGRADGHVESYGDVRYFTSSIQMRSSYDQFSD